MVVVNDIMINNLIRQKDTLIKQFELQHTIDEKTYRKKVSELDIELHKHNTNWIKQEQARIKEEDKQTKLKKKHWKEFAQQKAVEEYATDNGVKEMGIFDIFKKKDVEPVEYVKVNDIHTEVFTKVKTKKKKKVILEKQKEIRVKVKQYAGEPTLRGTIISVLSGGNVKNNDDTLKEVKKILPAIEDKKIMFFIKYIIGQVKLKNARFSKYSWDDDKYLIKVI